MTPKIEKRIKLVQAGKVPAGYKRTKIGIVPKEWHEVRFHDMFSRLMRKNKEGNTNVLTISAQYGLINQEEFFNKTVASDDKSNYFLLEKGEFAYNKSYSSGYPFGALKRLDLYEKGVVSPLYICFSANAANECPDFYVHYFEAGLMNKEIQAFAQEGARNHGLLNIAVDDFFNSNLLCPPKKEQEKIAEILAAQDRVIALKEKLIAEKQRRKHSLVDFYLNYKNCKEIPLNEICVLNDTCVKKENEEKSFYYLDIASVNNGRIDIPQNKQKIKDAPVRARRLIKKYDVLMSTVRPYLHAFAFIDFDAQEFVASTGFAVLSFKSKFDSYLVYHQLFSRKLDKQYEALLVGGNYPALNSKDIENLLVFIPSQEEKKEKIYNLLSAADEEISLLQKDLEQEKLKKKSLMQLLLTGLVRVSA
ncbi:type I restriction enzyme, S subunit [Fibrobacter sp. UWH9]|uniref:restriction endonuclease subunit S n=1 Tax=Fibrobacter sp. UWH9 TaxID=1896213 RepID=UPI000913D347|nr:restriction endonuclease subunit S [Fibrobacter sp. UWH9]SHG94352.1 type I restriction enzyme, S subunit [Fibrobacter sp. UWH9]